jgi:hypothetical protein
VARNPSGMGAPNPGGESATTSSRPSSARRGPQIASVSGLPCTSTTGMALTLTRVRINLAPDLGVPGHPGPFTWASLHGEAPSHDSRDPAKWGRFKPKPSQRGQVGLSRSVTAAAVRDLLCTRSWHDTTSKRARKCCYAR